MPITELPAHLRTELRRQLRRHPQIREHVRNPSEVNSLNKKRLLEIANALSIDLDDVRRAEFMDDYFPFRGRLIMPIAYEILGRKIERKLRVTLSYAPGWEHFDPREEAVVPGSGPSWAMTMEIFAIRDSIDTSRKGIRSLPPKWVEIKDFHEDGVLPQELIWEIEELFDRRFQQVNEEKLDSLGTLSASRRERIRNSYPEGGVSEKFSNLVEAVEILPVDRREEGGAAP